MFNIIVDKEYEFLFESLRAENPGSFSLTLADISNSDSKLNELLHKANAIIGQVNLSDVQYKTAANLRIIQTLSAGFDRIDLEKASRNNVLVANNNGANAVSVAEHVLMLIFALYRRLIFHHQSVASGQWKNLKHSNREFSGKKLGIFGLGHVGKALAQRASALGAKVQYFDILRQPEAEKKWNLTFLFPDELLSSSDIISYHVPKTSFTRNLINHASISKMQPGALLINSSRGDVQDENAIVEALNSGKIFGAGLDVFEVEPLPKNSPLCKLNNVVLTPHSSPDRECYFRTVKHAMDNLQKVSKGIQPLAIAVDHEERTRKFLDCFPQVKLTTQ